jgi:hypothetical protein
MSYEEPELLIRRIPLAPEEQQEIIHTQQLRTQLHKRTIDHVLQNVQRCGAKIAITSCNRTDGVGAQAVAKISALVCATALNQLYAHKPFEHVEHVDSNKRASVYCDEWERMLNIGSSGGHQPMSKFPIVTNLCTSQDPIAELCCQVFKPGQLYCFRDCYSFCDVFCDEPALIDAWEKVITNLRGGYQHSDDYSFKLQPDLTRVSVHIRRGDVQQSNNLTSSRYLSTNYYIEQMKRFADVTQHVVFNIVTDGTPDEMKPILDTFSDSDAKVHIHYGQPTAPLRIEASRSAIAQPRNQQNVLALKNKRTQPQRQLQQSKQDIERVSAVEAFRTLVNCDVLIMSRSAFSFLAGLYSKSLMKIVPPITTVMTIPKWCKEHDGWETASNIQHSK